MWAEAGWDNSAGGSRQCSGRGAFVALWVTHRASISLQGKSSLLLSMHKTAAMKQVLLNPNYPLSSCY